MGSFTLPHSANSRINLQPSVIPLNQKPNKLLMHKLRGKEKDVIKNAREIRLADAFVIAGSVCFGAFTKKPSSRVNPI